MMGLNSRQAWRAALTAYRTAARLRGNRPIGPFPGRRMTSAAAIAGNFPRLNPACQRSRPRESPRLSLKPAARARGLDGRIRPGLRPKSRRRATNARRSTRVRPAPRVSRARIREMRAREALGIHVVGGVTGEDAAPNR